MAVPQQGRSPATSARPEAGRMPMVPVSEVRDAAGGAGTGDRGMGGSSRAEAEVQVPSIFPGPEVMRDDRVVIAVRNCPKPPPTRSTLTLSATNTAAEVWLVVAGQAKAAAVAAALSGADAQAVPAAGVHRVTATRWWLDAPAASEVSTRRGRQLSDARRWCTPDNGPHHYAAGSRAFRSLSALIRGPQLQGRGQRSQTLANTRLPAISHPAYASLRRRGVREQERCSWRPWM